MKHRAIIWKDLDSKRETMRYKSELFGKVVVEFMTPCPIDDISEIGYMYVASQYEEQFEINWEQIKFKFEWKNN